jgi:sodium-dependent dicarboxylate transporter 2/3/5
MPVTLLPILGAVSVTDAAAPYAHDILFLFFGGFMLGLALERSGLHRRVALHTLRLIGTSPPRIIAGFMIAAAFLSGWVSNTATAILMMPIAISVVTLIDEQSNTKPNDETTALGGNFATAMLLGIAYAASIGGIATLIGTPPNLVLAAVSAETLGVEISMARWIAVAGPMVLVFLPIAWITLTRFIFPTRVKTIPGARELVNTQIRTLGPIGREEMLVLVLFCLTAAAWVLRPQIVKLGVSNDWPVLANLRDSSIAMLAAVAMFMIPSDIPKRRFLMDWQTVSARMPWGIFLLFGGGLSLAAAITATGLAEFIAGGMEALAGMPVWLLVIIIAVTVNFLTEVTSNTALTTALLPILAASAPVLGIDPLTLLVPATIAASLAFMLPVATPPNAVVFATGKVKIGDMIKAGIILNLIGAALASIVGLFFSGYIAG